MAAKAKAAPMPAQAEFDKFLTRFEKSYGKDTLVKASVDADKPYDVISTGSLDVDDASGVGGYVRGRLVEIWGNDAVGKSTLAMMGVAEAQKAHPTLRTAWIDMERVFDKPWARAHGINLDNNYLFRPDSAEDVADAMKDMVRSGLFSMVVLDSIGAMIPEAEKEKDADQAVMAAQAKIVTRMVKIAAVEADKTQTVVLLLNQVRANLAYGADTTTGGGFALKHCTTHKLKLSRTGTMPFKVGEDTVGHEIKIMFERNKVAPPHKVATMVLYNQASEKYGPVGIDLVDEAATVGMRRGVIAQSGAWYTLPTGERVQGRESVVKALRDDPAVVSMVRERVLALNAGEIVLHDLSADLAAAEAEDD